MIGLTIGYVTGRHAFRRPIGRFHATRFASAEVETEAQTAQASVDGSVHLLNSGRRKVDDAVMGRSWTAEIMKEVVGRGPGR